MDIRVKITAISPTSHRKQRIHQSCGPFAQLLTLPRTISPLTPRPYPVLVQIISLIFQALTQHILKDAVHPGPPLHQSGPSIMCLQQLTLFCRSLSLMIKQRDWVINVHLLDPILHSWKFQVLFTLQSPSLRADLHLQ